MKKIHAILGTLAIATGAVSYAVSIEMKTLTAVSISDVKTTISDSGTTTETRLDFSGPGLKFLMDLLPKALDGENNERPLSDLRVLKITNFGQPGINEHNSTTIYLECSTRRSPVPSCSVTVFKGDQPG